MSIKIKLRKNYYIREETTKEGYLVSRREYEMKYLSGVMKNLVDKAEPDDSQKLLNALRVSYKLLKPISIEFIDKIDLKQL